MATGERKAIRAGAPAFEPITLAEAKKHVELADDDNAHDAHLPPTHTADIQARQAAVLLQCLGEGRGPFITDLIT